MLDRNDVRHEVPTDPSTSAPPSGPLTVTASVALPDRIAAVRHTYSDLFAAARRRLLYILIGLVLVLLMLMGFSSWQNSGRQGIGAFALRFVDDLFGLGGLPILVVAVPLLVYYARHGAVVRNRLRRWFRDEGLDQPLEVTFRFEPDGLAVIAAGRCTMLACSRIKGVVQTNEHLFIQILDIEDVYVLPLRELSAGQIDQIKAWSAHCLLNSDAAPPARLDQDTHADEQPLLVARFQMTVEDRAMAIGWQMNRPALRRRRHRGFLLAFLLTALIVPLVFVLLWLLDPARVPWRYTFPLLVEMFTGTFWKYVLGFWAFIAAIMLLQPWTRRRQAYTLAQQLHKRVRAVAHELRLYPDRIALVQDGVRDDFEMAGFERIERQNQHLVLLRHKGEPLMLPMRALEDNHLALLERTINDRNARQDPSPVGQP